MSTALSTIISDIKLQDADVVRAQLLARIKIPAGLWVLHACDQTTLLQPSAPASRYTEDEHRRLCRQRPIKLAWEH
jgi:hypothetical protein